MASFVTLTRNIFTEVPRGQRRSEQRTWVREVEVPAVSLASYVLGDGVTPPANTGFEDGLLDRIFHYGQNDVQVRTAPSLSTGDLIVLDDANGRRVFAIEAVGFKRLNLDDLTGNERLMVRFATSNLHEAKEHQFDETAADFELVDGDKTRVRFLESVRKNG